MPTQTDVEPKDHLLVRTIQAVLEGQADAARLQKVLSDSRNSLATEHAGFNEVVGGLGEELSQACGPLLGQAEELFQQFSAALDLVEEYLKTSDKEFLFSANSLVDRVVTQINAVQLEIRNRVLTAQGPTDIPNLNLLIRAHGDYKEGRDPKGERLLDIIDAEIFHGVSSIENIKHSPQTPEMLAMSDALAAHVEGMKRLGSAVVKEAKDKVVIELKRAEHTFQEMKSRIAPATMSVRLEGPTKAPVVNNVLSLTEEMLRGSVPDIALVDALHLAEKEFKEMRTQFDTLTQRQATSVLVTEEVERAREAFELQEAALKEYEEFFANREIAFAQAAAAKLKRSTQALYMCYEELQAIAEREGKTPCFRCNHYNTPNRSRCEKCGAALPAMVQEESSSTFETAEADPMGSHDSKKPVLTPNFVRLYTAVNGAADGTLSDEAFLAEIAWFEDLLKKNSEFDVAEPDLESMSEEERANAEQTLKAIQDTEDMFRSGYENLQEALKLFREFVESRETGDLEDGVKLCDQGARKLAAVKAATQTGANPSE